MSSFELCTGWKSSEPHLDPAVKGRTLKAQLPFGAKGQELPIPLNRNYHPSKKTETFH